MAIFLLIFVALFTTPDLKDPAFSNSKRVKNNTDTIPLFIKGEFKDDYGIRYTIDDSVWVQHPTAKYYILSWNNKEQYLIARNDYQNASEKGLYTRIDFMKLHQMEPWAWGFCLTVYNAASASEAENKPQADRQNPKKGCNGFPFSRMKKN
jgi:hypothetical protein